MIPGNVLNRIPQQQRLPVRPPPPAIATKTGKEFITVSSREVKKESESEDQQRLGARQSNLVRLSLKSGEKAITLTVRMQNEEELCYRIGMNTKMRFLMKDYCERKGLGFGTIKFFGPEGDRLRESQTPQDLVLEDDDAIDAFHDQIGGLKVFDLGP